MPPALRPLLRWLPALAWAGVIFLLSAQPDLRIARDPDVDFVVRKAGHMAAFGALAVLVRLALGGRRGAPLLAWLVAVFYAATDELHQSLVPGRHAAATDVAIDGVGAALGLLFVVAAIRVAWRLRPARLRA